MWVKLGRGPLGHKIDTDKLKEVLAARVAMGKDSLAPDALEQCMIDPESGEVRGGGCWLLGCAARTDHAVFAVCTAFTSWLQGAAMLMGGEWGKGFMDDTNREPDLLIQNQTTATGLVDAMVDLPSWLMCSCPQHFLVPQSAHARRVPQ